MHKEDEYYEMLFAYTLTDDEVDRFLEDRRCIARDLDKLHQLKKQFEKEKDFMFAKELKPFINDLESQLKAYRIVKNILIDGVPGRIPQFPKELLPHIRLLDRKYS